MIDKPFKLSLHISDIKILPRKIRKKFKRTKKNSMPSPPQTEETSGNSSVISKGYGKLKNHLLKFKKKSKPKIVDSKIPFNNVHEKYGQRIQDDNLTEENTTD